MFIKHKFEHFQLFIGTVNFYEGNDTRESLFFISDYIAFSRVQFFDLLVCSWHL